MTRARPALIACVALGLSCATSTRTASVETRAATSAAPAAAGRYGPEPVIASSPLESTILEEVRRRGAEPLHASGSLSLAARALARGISAGLPDPLAPARIRTALAFGLAYDPAPRVFRVDGPASSTATSLAASIYPEPADTHVGVGAVASGDRVHVVVLLSPRLASLAPFPREVMPGQRVSLQGQLATLARPSVHLTSPSGESRTVPLRRESARFEAALLFDRPGRWTVEVVGESSRGPQVAALLTVSCGGASLEIEPTKDPPDPDDPREAEARVVAAIARTRAQYGLPPLQASPALAHVARQHAEAMLRAGVLAHHLAPNDGAAERLRRAHVPFALVLENVAKGPSAITAHRLAEESPAHRQNILSEEATRVGIGIARGNLPGGEPVVYLTELFTAVAGDPGQDPLTPEARVREVLWRERARLGATPLVADASLDELARTSVREMLRRGAPDPGDLPERALARGRRTAAADAFVTAKPADAVRSRNLSDARFHRVGVAVAIGEEGRVGAGLLWIVVIYTD